MPKRASGNRQTQAADMARPEPYTALVNGGIRAARPARALESVVAMAQVWEEEVEAVSSRGRGAPGRGPRTTLSAAVARVFRRSTDAVLVRARGGPFTTNESASVERLKLTPSRA